MAASRSRVIFDVELIAKAQARLIKAFIRRRNKCNADIRVCCAALRACLRSQMCRTRKARKISRYKRGAKYLRATSLPHARNFRSPLLPHSLSLSSPICPSSLVVCRRAFRVLRPCNSFFVVSVFLFPFFTHFRRIFIPCSLNAQNATRSSCKKKEKKKRKKNSGSEGPRDSSYSLPV